MPPSTNTSSRAGARVVGALLWFALGFALAAWLLGAWITPRAPARDIGPHSRNLRTLAREPERGQVLVLGASRVLNGFSPAAYEEGLAASGVRAKAFNLSLQRLQLWEQEQVLADALAVPGVKPRLIIIEPVLGLGIAPENLTQARTIHMETAAAFRLATSSILASGRSPAQNAWNIATHGAVAGLHAAGYGRLSSVAFPPFTPPIQYPDPGYLAIPGLRPGEPPPAWLAETREQYLANLTLWRGSAPPAPPHLLAYFAAWRARLEAGGAKVVFWHPPLLGFPGDFYRGQMLGLEAAWAAQPGFPQVSHLDPVLHPALYDARLWSDPLHLRRPGAEILSRLLAEETAPLLKEPAP
jgi:hypothetical protein